MSFELELDNKWSFRVPDKDFRVHVLRYGAPWGIFDTGASVVEDLITEVNNLRVQLQAERERNMASTRTVYTDRSFEFALGKAARSKGGREETLIKRAKWAHSLYVKWPDAGDKPKFMSTASEVESTLQFSDMLALDWVVI